MITFSPAALDYIRSKNQPIFLDFPPLIGCCIHIQEAPEIRFGKPKDEQNYYNTEITDITVYIPFELPDIPITIGLTSFLGMKKLVVEGWRLA